LWRHRSVLLEITGLQPAMLSVRHVEDALGPRANRHKVLWNNGLRHSLPANSAAGIGLALVQSSSETTDLAASAKSGSVSPQRDPSP
jgi:hypothetical protein